MDSPSIHEAVAKATPNVTDLLDRHANWCAQMCRNVPSPSTEMFRNVPSNGATNGGDCSKMFPDVPEGSRMFHHTENGGTNPSVYRPRERPLTERQHACARLLVQGCGTLDIAHHLGVEHHTIARWKRNAAFQLELGRLRAMCTASAVTHPKRSAPATPPAPPSRGSAPALVRMTRAEIEQEDRECEAMVARALAARAAQKGG